MSPYHPGWLCCLNLTLIEWAWSEDLARSIVGHSVEQAQLHQGRHNRQKLLPAWAS
jgi:hypothetical protein